MSALCQKQTFEDFTSGKIFRQNWRKEREAWRIQMFCTKCGIENLAAARFCEKCGHAMHRDEGLG